MVLRETRYPVVYSGRVVGSVVLEADWHKVRDEQAGNSVLQSTWEMGWTLSLSVELLRSYL